jgi:DNA gyrase subunit B
MAENYNAEQIEVLQGLEPVRKRPGMYIGSTGPKGLHHLVYEIVDNAIDEVLAGYCDTITVEIMPENVVKVTDNGRGIPTGIHPTEGISAATVVYTVLHAGGKFGGSGYKVSGGLHGVGASVVNALSEWLEVTVFDGKNVHFQHFDRGEYTEPMKIIGETDKTGTQVVFKPDSEIFIESIEFDYETLLRRLREQAFLNPSANIIFTDRREEEVTETLHYDGGIREFVQYLHSVRDLTPISKDVVYFSGETKIAATDTKDERDLFAEIAFQYNESYNDLIISFANNIHTPDGGFHEIAFKNSLLRVLNEYGKKFNFLKDEKLTGDDVREGLTAIISVRLQDAEFEGQTKGRLGNPEVKPFVEGIISTKLMDYLDENPSIAGTILDKAISAKKAREAAKKARDLSRKKSGMESASLPGKLADCSSSEPEKNEIYIVEGDSAGGSAKEGRDRRYQAILPLWGKMLNVERARIDKVYTNEKLMPVVAALGTSIGEDFDLEKLRYHKVIIMADADVDGSHIRTLLLTFFFRFMRPLIENGNIYIAQPPLFKVQKGKKFKYAFSDEERDLYISEMEAESSGKIDVQRYKGLGEMDPHQLWETTMDPDTRIMLRVELDDAVKADEIFSILMGDKVAPRRDFIEKNAKYAVNIDI